VGGAGDVPLPHFIAKGLRGVEADAGTTTGITELALGFDKVRLDLDCMSDQRRYWSTTLDHRDSVLLRRDRLSWTGKGVVG